MLFGNFQGSFMSVKTILGALAQDRPPPKAAGSRTLHWPLLESQRPSLRRIPFPFLYIGGQSGDAPANQPMVAGFCRLSNVGTCSLKSSLSLFRPAASNFPEVRVRSRNQQKLARWPPAFVWLNPWQNSSPLPSMRTCSS
jgi:hypothetical protein